MLFKMHMPSPAQREGRTKQANEQQPAVCNIYMPLNLLQVLSSAYNVTNIALAAVQNSGTVVRLKFAAGA